MFLLQKGEKNSEKDEKFSMCFPEKTCRTLFCFKFIIYKSRLRKPNCFTYFIKMLCVQFSLYLASKNNFKKRNSFCY